VSKYKHNEERVRWPLIEYYERRFTMRSIYFISCLVVLSILVVWLVVDGVPSSDISVAVSEPVYIELPVEFKSMDVGVFEATGYAIGPPYASIVKSGHPVVNKGFMSLGDVEIFTVAVDPRVIPLGSVLWIEGLGLGMATDTGRNIKGRRIDICFRTMRQACRFGRGDVNVVMLRSGK